MKWYQNATINGKPMPAMRQGDTSGKRWDNLIKPLIPFEGEGRLFIELGSNAGFYLRKAKEMGFNVMGIDNNPGFVKQARFWEEKEPRGVRTIEGDLVDWDFPCASIILLANVHYWLTPNQLARVVRRLRRKALYVIVVGRHRHHPTMKSPNDTRTLKWVFGKWRIAKTATTAKHYAIRFKSKLLEKDVGELLVYQKTSKYFYPTFIDFIKGRGEMYLRYLKKNISTKGERYYHRHGELLKSIKENGILTPIRVDGGTVINGNHRLVIADYLGQRKVICQQLSI
jgi:hypothetical protein